MPPAGYPTRGPWTFRNLSRDFDFWPTLESISISQEHPEALANMTCQIVDQTATLVFANEDECEATFNGERIWAGILTSVVEDQVSQVGPRMWEISGEDYTTKLDDAIVRRRTKRKREKVRRRIRWLLRWLKPNIWTLDGRDIDVPDTYIESYEYYGNTVREALQQVADELRLFFYVDLDNVFHMFRTEVLAAPFDLDNEAPDYVTTFPFDSYRNELDSVDLANAVLVEPEKRRNARWSKDTASIAAYNRQERFISDTTLQKPQQALNYGQRTLAQVAQPTEDATCRVPEPGLRAGMRINLREVLWDHDYERIIKAVEISAVDPHDSEGNAYLFSDITLTDRRPARGHRGDAGNRGRRHRHHHPANVDARVLDNFTDDVSEPTIITDVAFTTFATPLTVSKGMDMDEVTELGPYIDTAPSVKLAGSHLSFPGQYDPPNHFLGWWEGETWYKVTSVPTHPGSAAGVRVSVGGAFGISGYAAYTTARYEFVVSASEPTDTRQGTVVGTFVADGSFDDLDIPIGSVPSAGASMWVGVRSQWQANYGEEAYAFNWPWNATSGQLDEGGVFYMGRSGRAQFPTTLTATWLVYTSSGGDLGTADSPAKAPYEGGWTWHDAGTEGSPVYGVDDGYLYLRSTAAAGKGFLQLGEYEDDDEPAAPWSDVRWGLEVMFDISAAGLTNQAGLRQIEVTTTGHDERTVGLIHLGDMVRAAGLEVLGPTGSDYEAFTISASTRYLALFDSRSSYEMRGRIWNANNRMPANILVRTPLDETEDDADRWSLWLRGGNIVSEQIIRVRRVRYLPSAHRAGMRIDRELVGRADGLTKKFYVNEQFREGTLRLIVNGTAITPEDEDPDEAWGKLDFWPTAGSVIRANYVVD